MCFSEDSEDEFGLATHPASKLAVKSVSPPRSVRAFLVSWCFIECLRVIVTASPEMATQLPIKPHTEFWWGASRVGSASHPLLVPRQGQVSMCLGVVRPDLECPSEVGDCFCPPTQLTSNG